MGERLVPRILGKDEMQLLEGFAAALAHALGTPLTVLMLAAERLTQSLTDASAQERDAALLMAEVYRLAQVQRFLLEACDSEGAVHRRIDVNESVRQAVALLAGPMGDRGVRPYLRLDPAPICTTGDPLLLQRAFLDLVGAVGRDLTHVEVRTCRKDSSVEISIALYPFVLHGDEEWRARFGLWRTDGSPGALWRAWQFACRRRGQVEIGTAKNAGMRVTIRWPEEEANQASDRPAEQH
jgi:hypothetical protein